MGHNWAIWRSVLSVHGSVGTELWFSRAELVLSMFIMRETASAPCWKTTAKHAEENEASFPSAALRAKKMSCAAGSSSAVW
jgi:hypothetical protein